MEDEDVVVGIDIDAGDVSQGETVREQRPAVDDLVGAGPGGLGQRWPGVAGGPGHEGHQGNDDG